MAVYYSFYGILDTAVVIQNYEIQHLITKVIQRRSVICQKHLSYPG